MNGVRLFLLFIISVIGMNLPVHAIEDARPSPEVLKLQKELVESLDKTLKYVMGRGDSYQRIPEIVYTMELYAREFEAQKVFEAIGGKKNVSQKEITMAKINARSEILSKFKEINNDWEARYQVGEIYGEDLAFLKSAELKAQINLELLKSEAAK